MNIQKYSGQLQNYILSSGEIAGGASKVMMDIFNASGSGVDLLILGLYISPKTDAAVTGAVAARFDLFRTSSVGTGGTRHSFEAPVSSALNISRLDSKNALLPDQITARTAPSGGAALGPWLLGDYIFPEETADSANLIGAFNLLPATDRSGPVVLHEGEGLVVQQGSVASVNSFTFNLELAVAGGIQVVSPRA